jgi:hypothetical protein
VLHYLKDFFGFAKVLWRESNQEFLTMKDIYHFV